MHSKKALWLITACLSFINLQAQFISEKKEPGAFPIVTINGATAVYVDSSETFLARKAATFLQNDILMVTGHQSALLHQLPASGNSLIIIGTAGSSPIINQLIAAKKLDAGSLLGKWETYQLQVVEKPCNGVGYALVISGSDRRSTAYGVFELSR